MQTLVEIDYRERGHKVRVKCLSCTNSWIKQSINDFNCPECDSSNTYDGIEEENCCPKCGCAMDLENECLYCGYSKVSYKFTWKRYI